MQLPLHKTESISIPRGITRPYSYHSVTAAVLVVLTVDATAVVLVVVTVVEAVATVLGVLRQLQLFLLSHQLR